MKEKWKELEGNREIYLISDQGNIRTKTRPGARGTIVQGHSLITHENSSGYLRADIHLKGEPKGKSYFVHRLVAEKFVPNYDNKPFINHKDGNKHNNSAKNLEWCTRSENEKHAWKTGLKSDIATKGEAHGMHKLTAADVSYIRKNHIRNGGSMKTGDFAKQFHVKPQTITDAVSKRTWKCLKDEECEV